MKRKLLALAAFSAFTAIPHASSANDSEASVPLGGLELRQSQSITMDSEDLYLSQEEVRVKYRFTNTSSKDVEALIAFPLPEYPAQEEYLNNEYFRAASPEQLDFKTRVDGKPINLGLEYVAKLKGKNVNAALGALGIPINWLAVDYDEKLKKIPQAKLVRAVKQGLLSPAGDSFFANWTLAENITRKQLFPAGKTVTVEHSYKPSIGGSVAGMLTTDRKSDYYREYAAQYCLDKSFLAGFDKRIGKSKPDEYVSYYGETWLDYVLKSGANWKGPIKDFRLVIDKGSTDNLVSFCMDGVKKISPTQFEVRKTNFEPKSDLSILIVKFYKPETAE